MTKFQYVLAIMIIAGFFGLAALFIFEPTILSDFGQKNVGLMTGAIITNFSMVVGYFFGSSKSSSDKTSLMANAKHYPGVGNGKVTTTAINQ